MSFANTTSLLALFVALGGTGYAALKIPRHSVGSAQLKNNAVSTSKVKNGALLSRDFKVGEIPIGATGATGATGLQGPKGDTGAAGTNGTNGTNGVQGPSGIAAAFARVAGDGTPLQLVPPDNSSFPSQSKDVTAANIVHTAATGVYCFIGLPFSPASAMVSTDNAGASMALENNVVASVAIGRGNVLNGCAAGANARVVTTKWSETAAPANTDHGFTIWFEK
jgi:hypothetical protein